MVARHFLTKKQKQYRGFGAVAAIFGHVILRRKNIEWAAATDPTTASRLFYILCNKGNCLHAGQHYVALHASKDRTPLKDAFDIFNVHSVQKVSSGQNKG